MHALHIIEDACVTALDDDEEDKACRMAEFRSLADPLTVLELVQVAKRAVPDNEHHEMLALIRDLARYVEEVPDIDGKAKHLDARMLLMQAKVILGVTTI